MILYRSISAKAWKISLCTLILSAVACCFNNPAFSQDKTEKIDEFIKKCFEYRIFNGTVLVAENGKIVYENALGPAVREWNVPNSTDTKFMIGSVSKQFTAMLILQLVEEGKLSLDDRLSKFIPYYPGEKADKITVFKKKPKKRYERTIGHRQAYTVVEVMNVK